MHRRIFAVTLILLLTGLGSWAVSAELSPALERKLATAEDTDQLPVVLFLNNRLTMEEVYPDARALPMEQRREFVMTVLKDRFAQMGSKVMDYLELARKDDSVSLLRPLWILNGIRTTAAASVLRELVKYPEILYMEYDPRRSNTLDDGWGVTEIGALRVQDSLGVTGEGVIVGHKDSGINYLRTGFAGRIWINPGEDINGDGVIDGTDINGVDDDRNGYIDDFRGWNFDDDINDVIDTHSHGTRTASVICSNEAGCGRISVAPGAKLMILRGYEFQGSVWESSQYAIEHGVHVISASLSFKQSDCSDNGTLSCPNRVAHRWVSEMELAAGIIHANSTGNEGVSNPIPMSASAPSDCPPPVMTTSHSQQGGVSSVVAVAGYISSGDYYSSSGRGPSAWSREDICSDDRMPFCGPPGTAGEYPPEFEDYPYQGGAFPGLLKPDITAPTNVDALGLSSGCSSIGGTSGATPHVGGALALIYSAFPGISPEDAYLVLVNGALDAGDAGADNLWGFGKLRIFDSIEPDFTTLGGVAGQVLSEGVPVEGVRVTLDSFRPVYTDENGEYEIRAESGVFTIQFYKYGYQTIDNSVSITAPNTTIGNVSLLEAANGSLRITLDGQGIQWGPGIENISIALPAGELEGITNHAGVVIFPEVPNGIHQVIVGENQDFYHIASIDVDVDGATSITIPIDPSNAAQPTGSLDFEGYMAYDDLDQHGPDFEWVEINPDLGGDGERISFSGDACISRTLPFSFSFYGNSTTSIRISPNGYITFDSSCRNGWDVVPIPSEETPDALCAVLWQDYYPEDAGGGDVYYYADEDRAIVEWYDVQQWTGYPPGRATFQAILQPMGSGDGWIICQYAAINGRIEATVGIEDYSGQNGLLYSHQLHYTDGSAQIRDGRAILFTPEILDNDNDRPVLPGKFALYQNYPNPFNPSTTFTFDAPTAALVDLSLFDLLGRQTATIFEGIAETGVNRITYDASHLPAGMYFARLTANGEPVGIKKVMLLK